MGETRLGLKNGINGELLVSITCGECGAETSAEILNLVDDQQIPCSGCGGTFRVPKGIGLIQGNLLGLKDTTAATAKKMFNRGGQ